MNTHAPNSPESPKVPISSHTLIVCIHNGYKDVVECLNSIQENWDDEGLTELILVDDFSDEETADYVKNFSNQFSAATLVRLSEQHFYTRAANAGLRLSTGDLTTLLNSDTIVTAGWARKIRNVFEHDPNVGIAGPLSNAASTQSVPNVKSKDGQTAINQLPEGMSVARFATALDHLASGLTVPYVPLIHGFCYTIHRKVIDTIGYLDEKNFPTGYGEENDYSFRADDAGFALAVALNSFVYHAKSKSYNRNQQQSFTQAGQKALTAKYNDRRIQNAVKLMENQPSLVAIRDKVEKFWPEHNWLQSPSSNNLALSSQEEPRTPETFDQW